MTERRSLVGVAIGLGALTALGVTTVSPPAPRLVWNVSSSAPVGLYQVWPERLPARGDFVVARLPSDWRMLAATRHYLPANVPLVKGAAALSGDRVCAMGRDIFINGRRAVMRLRFDAAGRPMPWWKGCRTLRNDELFLLMTSSKASFDGRYFGPTSSADIVGSAELLWRR